MSDCGEVGVEGEGEVQETNIVVMNEVMAAAASTVVFLAIQQVDLAASDCRNITLAISSLVSAAASFLVVSWDSKGGNGYCHTYTVEISIVAEEGAISE